MEKAQDPIQPDLVAETAELVKRPNPRARASVRTTFRLSAEALEGLEWLARQSGVTKKETFDELCNWLDVLKKKNVLNKETFLKLRETHELLKKYSGKHRGDLIRKTYVISDQARRTLEKTAKDYKVSRDDLLGNLILLVKGLIEAHEKKRLSNHAAALKMIDDFWHKAEDLESKLHELLGDDDPIYERFGMVVTGLMALSQDIEAEQKDGTPIDSW